MIIMNKIITFLYGSVCLKMTDGCTSFTAMVLQIQTNSFREAIKYPAKSGNLFPNLENLVLFKYISDNNLADILTSLHVLFAF
jgi:hypothetical protein